MNLASIVILVIIGLALFAAIRYNLKNGTGCESCGGSCSGNCRSCGLSEEDRAKIPDRFKLKQ
jgi:hypothetical protein